MVRAIKSVDAMQAGLIGVALLTLSSAASSAEPGRNILFVIGTTHESTSAYSSKKLADILDTLKPDVVLLEGDPTYFDDKGLKQRYRRGQEGEATAAYQHLAGVGPKPFDIDGRDRFFAESNYFKKQDALLSHLQKLYDDGSLNVEAKLLYEAIGNYSDLGNKLAAERPDVINTEVSDAVMAQKQHYVFDGLARIIEVTPQLKGYETFWGNGKDFWIRRNDAMVQNILKYNNQGSGKRIAILCGFEHRGYVRRELMKQAQANSFEVREFWAPDTRQDVPIH